MNPSGRSWAISAETAMGNEIYYRFDDTKRMVWCGFRAQSLKARREGMRPKCLVSSSNDIRNWLCVDVSSSQPTKPVWIYCAQLHHRRAAYSRPTKLQNCHQLQWQWHTVYTELRILSSGSVTTRIIQRLLRFRILRTSLISPATTINLIIMGT